MHEHRRGLNRALFWLYAAHCKRCGANLFPEGEKPAGEKEALPRRWSAHRLFTRRSRSM